MIDDNDPDNLYLQQQNQEKHIHNNRITDVSANNYYEALNWPIKDFIDYSNHDLDESKKSILQQKFKENFILRAHFLQCEQSFKENDITTVAEWNEFISSELHDNTNLTKSQKEDFEKVHRKELLGRIRSKNKF